MSNFKCEHCGALILDSPLGYTTGCEHYPIEKPHIPIRHSDLWYAFVSGEIDLTTWLYEMENNATQ